MAREHHRFQGDPAGSEASNVSDCFSGMSQRMGLSQSGVHPKVAKKCHLSGEKDGHIFKCTWMPLDLDAFWGTPCSDKPILFII